MATHDEAREALETAGFEIKDEKDVEHGRQFRTFEGPILCVWNKGTVSATGKNKEALSSVVEELSGARRSPKPKGGKTKVFVVYGHDRDARAQMESMLRRWELNPIILDQRASGGSSTLIEKLERYRADVEYAVVLATPDDEGHRRGISAEKKLRARQNVVLELGMMLGFLDRSRVAVVQPNLPDDQWEGPSDINGVVYLGYDNSVTDVRVQLFQEMLAVGIRIDPQNL